MKRSLACAAVFVLLVAGVTTANAVTVLGSRSCGTWLEHRKVNGSQAKATEAWLVGYLSGLALGYQIDFLKQPDAVSLYAWVDNYCLKNPLDPLFTAGESLALELTRRMK